MGAKRRLSTRSSAQAANEAVSVSEVDQRLQCLIDLTVDFYWEQDASQRFTLLRPALEGALDAALEQALAEFTLQGLTVGRALPEGWLRYQAALEARQPFRDLICELRDAQDVTRYLSFSGQPAFDAGGALCGYRGVARDVTAEVQSRGSEERFASMMELAAIGIAHVDDDGRLLYANPQLCKMLQYTEGELIGKTVKEISHPEDADVTDEMRDRLHAGQIDSFKIEKRYVCKDGSPIWVGLTIAAKRDHRGGRIADVSIVEDISARKRAEERVRYLATHDALTGLPNRAMFGELLNLALESSKRHSRRVAVLFIDLDRFKVINDSLGHEAGDVLLREISSRLRDCLYAGDVVARLGGDEFVVLIQEVHDVSHVAIVARKILSATLRPVVILGQECRVTASIGISVHPSEGQDERSVLKNADMAMYQAKEDGKNTFRFYSSEIQAQTSERLALETHLRRALELNELTLHYQAKVSFESNAITGVEALLRWKNPLLGNVFPTQFIPVAEETGLIVAIGKWVLRTACAQNVAWQRQGLPPVRVCVNLSMRQLSDPGLVVDIENVLNDTGLTSDLLELEMTESMIMHNAEHAVCILTAIKALGVRLAIDDFGTGYSSLAHLKRFPIDTLKVDRSFIREIPRDSEDRAIAEAIIAMGKTLNLTIVAEGVETAEQQSFLREHACDEMQGYYFSMPLAPEDFADLLKRHSMQGKLQ